MWGNNNNSSYSKGYGSSNSSYSSYGGGNSSGYGNNHGFGGGKSGNWNDSELGSNLAPIDWTKENITPFQKVFYKESEYPKSQEEIDSYYKINSISAKTPHGRMPEPFLSWEDTRFPSYIMKEISTAKFDKPTPIQALAFPIVLSGHDLIGIAETGSGKTLSFLLPAVVHINAQPTVKRGDGPIVLVLAPTRELAMQIENESEKFGNTSKLKCACIYGGAEKYAQRNLLQQGVDVVIATPGRLIDFLESNTTNLRRVTYLVLDEADRMLDMGFEIQIRKILGQIRPDRQTLMFSATWPKNVQNLAEDYCRNQPVHIQIGKHELSINERIKQIVYVTDSTRKTELCIKQLDQLTQKDKVLIFSQTKKGCDQVSRILDREGFKCMAIHGDKVQKDRDYVMGKFKSGECKILIATDVASRGLDVKDVSHVINYDFPKVLEDYIHRIGRTGRAGAYGCAISFICSSEDRKISREFVQLLSDAKQEIPIDLLDLAGVNSRYSNQYRPPSSSYYDIKKIGPQEKVSARYESDDKYSNKRKDDYEDKRERERSPQKQDNGNRYDRSKTDDNRSRYQSNGYSASSQSGQGYGSSQSYSNYYPSSQASGNPQYASSSRKSWE